MWTVGVPGWLGSVWHQLSISEGTDHSYTALSDGTGHWRGHGGLLHHHPPPGLGWDKSKSGETLHPGSFLEESPGLLLETVYGTRRGRRLSSGVVSKPAVVTPGAGPTSRHLAAGLLPGPSVGSGQQGPSARPSRGGGAMARIAASSADSSSSSMGVPKGTEGTERDRGPGEVQGLAALGLCPSEV